ncbi:MAG: hypothetical protein V8S39_00125 [Lachnospiraceae bacterium]|nr:MAG TPA: hypothetical protein [Caudoviricetes sp.]
MLNSTKSIILTGTSVVEATAEGEMNTVPVVYMSATIGDNDTPVVTKSIQNRELYLANKEQIDKDMQEFEDTAWSLVQ